MKTRITFKKVGSALLFLFLMMFSVASYSQACAGNNVTVSIANITNIPANNTVEFDIYITNTGTTALKLASLAGSVIHNVGFSSAGTFSVVTQPSANDFPTLNPIATTAYTVASRQLRWTNNPVLESAAVVLPAGVAKKFARFRFVSTADFTPNFAATLTLKEYVEGGFTAVNPNVYCNGNTSSTALANGSVGPPPINNGFLVISPTSNFIVNQTTTCFTSGTFTQTPACAVANNDGTVTVTMAPIPSSLSASYILDSGSSTPVTLSAAGAFTITGLASGAHTLSVTGSGPCTTPVSVPFTIGSTASVTPTFTQVAAICSGVTLSPLPTTSNNGVTGTWAPALDNMNTTTYTFTPSIGQCATTATMTITVNPSTNTTTTATACGSYTWAENGVTYTASGTYTVPATLPSGIVNGQTAWANAAAANGATVTTANLNGITAANPTVVTIGGVTATFSSPGGIYSSGGFLGANVANDPVTIAFSPAVYGAAGNYFVTNVSDVAIAGTITITYSDGTVDTQPVSAATDYFGFFKNAGITSIVIVPVATTPAVNRFVSIDNLSVATVPPCQTRTLNLTITPATNVVTTASACDSYTWSANGTTYTTSGSYTIPATLQSGIVNGQTNWANAAAANGATVTTSNLNGITAANPTLVTIGSVTASFSSPGGMYSSGGFLGANIANDPVTIAFSPAVYGAAGNFYVTNVSDVAIAGTITITYSDGTVDTQPVTAATDYFGYFKNTGITSIVIVPVATTPAVNRFVSIDNLSVALAPQCLTKTLNLTITPSTTNGSVTTSICAGGSYTWPAPGTGLAYTTAQTNLTNVIGCNTATLNLTVNPTTTNGSVTTSICAGSSYTWAAPLGTGLSYTTAQTNLVNVVGCNTATLNLTITPNTTNGSVTTSICSGSSYTWPLPNGTGASYTTAQTNLTNVVGCNTATLNLTINTAATPTGSANQSFNVVNMNDATVANLVVSPAGVTWFATLLDAQNNTNPLSPSTVLTNGATYYAVNTVGTCRSTPFAVTVTVTLGIDDFDSLNFAFYPNPTSSILNISYSRTISDLQVMNLLGQEVMRQKTNDSQVQIDLSSLADATYFIKVTSEDKSKIIKVIKSN